MKHSPGAAVTVDVERTTAAVSVRVRNEMCRPSSGAPTRVGRGIVGMRERAALLRGDLQIGPTTDGGWKVVATLPLKPVAP